METVLTILYLLFNEGYHSASNKFQIRKELCLEAIRLTLLLVENPTTNSPQANALLALMCFQSSRFDARNNELGESILYESQDQNLWNKELIQRGNFYLVNACDKEEISKYHLEAGIAYWHTTSTDDKWKQILRLYNQLILIEYSSITALNRAFAFAKVYGDEPALSEVKKLQLEKHSHYHALMGYLYAKSDLKKSKEHYEKAIELSKSPNEQKILRERLKSCASEI